MSPVNLSHDVLLLGGTVIDGTGADPYPADVAIGSGRIAAIAPPGTIPPSTASRVVSAEGRYVMPGFVDAHVHAETVLTQPDVQEAMLRQGITTVVLGQDGLSFAPGSASTIDYVATYFAAVNGQPPASWAGGVSVDDLLSYFDGRTPINVGYLVPLANARLEVMGASQGPALEKLPLLVGLVEEGLSQGALGISTGLEYVPGGFADIAELAALCAPAARVGAPYVSHLRSYAGGVAPGMSEALELVRRTGVPLHASHYRGFATSLLVHLEGVDATFDSYPHLYGNTILAMKALPPEIQAGGAAATISRLQDLSVRKELAREWFPRIQSELEVTILGYVASTKYSFAQGMTIGDFAEYTGWSYADLICELLVACDLVVNCIMPLVGGNSDDDIRELARDPRHMACSDGIYLGGHPHPRGWGAFAQFLGRHTRSLGDWTWAEAAQHLSANAARRFSLAGRGIVAVGKVADIAIVDPAGVREVATYDSPRQLAEGVNDVLVGGQLVLENGRLTGATPGRGLRRGEDSL